MSVGEHNYITDHATFVFLKFNVQILSSHCLMHRWWNNLNVKLQKVLTWYNLVIETKLSNPYSESGSLKTSLGHST